MSSIVAAALILTVLFADRLGPPREVRRRFFQVALAIVLALFGFGLTAVAIPLPGQEGLTALGDADPNKSVGDALQERTILLAGLGLLGVIVGLTQAARTPTLYLGLLVGGVFLLLSSPPESQLSVVYLSIAREGGIEGNGLYAAVTGIGAVILAIYGYQEWERALRGRRDENVEVSDEEELSGR